MGTVTMEIHVPIWVKREKGVNDILRNLLFEAYAKMEYYQSRMLSFERKYGVSFIKFEKKIKEAKKENFEMWDDLIIWEGFYQAYNEWKQRYKDIKECMKS